MKTEEKITYLTEIYKHFKNNNGRKILSDNKNLIRFVITPLTTAPISHYVEIENNIEADEIIDKFLIQNNVDDVNYYITNPRKVKWPSEKGYLCLQALEIEIHHI